MNKKKISYQDPVSGMYYFKEDPTRDAIEMGALTMLHFSYDSSLKNLYYTVRVASSLLWEIAADTPSIMLELVKDKLQGVKENNKSSLSNEDQTLLFLMLFGFYKKK